jgi:RNA ligase
MEVADILDEKALQAHLDAGIVKCQQHPELPIYILNYTQKAQFGHIWDEVTCLTRGLINNEAGEIIARPFRKFFNLGHQGRPETDLQNLPQSQPEVTEKLDGSLGILWQYDGHTGIATRGSFDSDQAKWATAWYHKHMSDAIWPEGYTPLFEIIYGENRIVVRYEWEGLSLLSLVHNDTGRELPYLEVAYWADRNGIKCVPAYNLDIAQCRANKDKNFEGYVLTWHDPYIKVKVKLDEYCRMHRIVTGFSPIALWEALRDGEDISSYTHDMPEDFVAWVTLHKTLMLENVDRVMDETRKVFDSRPTPTSDDPKQVRKEIALYLTTGRNKAFASPCFALLDGDEARARDIAWKSVRPHGAHPWKRVDE